MTLTYKQEPKKYNPTIRLKRIAQRFDTGYRNIRRFKEDISNHLTTRTATKRVLNLPLKPVGVMEHRKINPSKKWDVFVKQSQRFGRSINFITKQHQASIVFRRFFGYSFKKILNTEYQPKNLFFSGDHNKQIFFKQKNNNFYSSFLGVALRSFSIPNDLVLENKNMSNSLLVQRALQFELLDCKITLLEHVVKVALEKKLAIVGRTQRLVKREKSLGKKRLLAKLGEIKSKLLKVSSLILHNIKRIQSVKYKKSSKEIFNFRYGKITKKFPNKLIQTSQNNQIIEQIYQRYPVSPRNLKKTNIFGLISTPGKLVKKTPCRVLPTNIFNFTTRSHGVLYRFMMILREKFGIRKYDIPFRIDTYLTAYEKRPRPTVFKTMCLARGKIRLFYGQLTQRKTARLIKQTKAGFRGMFGVMERRLDVILVRSNFCKNIFTAQHLVRHGHILVNFKKLTNCFYCIKIYDVVTFKDREMEKLYKYMIFLKLKLNRFKFPMVPYLVVNYEYMYFYVKPIADARRSVGFTAPLSHGFLAKF